MNIEMDTLETMDIISHSPSYSTIEDQQAADLLSEVDQFEPIIRKDYHDFALTTARLASTKVAKERIQDMESMALDVYEEGLTSHEVPYNQRRQVADRVLEITGIIDKTKGLGQQGNTFVFSDGFAEKFLAAAGKVADGLPVVGWSDESDRSDRSDRFNTTNTTTAEETDE